MDWTRKEMPLDSADGDSGWERAAALVRAGNRIGATYIMCAQTGQGFHAAESAVATLAQVLESPNAPSGTSRSGRPSGEVLPGPARPSG